jgi:hypothetical protein
VGVEKVDIAENQEKSGDRKCPDDPRKSFKGILTRSIFCGLTTNEFFNSHRPMHSSSLTAGSVG